MDRAEYYQEIRDLAAEIAAEARKTGQDPYEVACEYVDGHEWVIYTGRNLEVLVASDNWLAIDDVGIDGYRDFSSLLAPAAYHAMLQDVLEALPPEEEEEEEEEADS